MAQEFLKQKEFMFLSHFFSTQRNTGKVGLALNVINNTITNTYQGEIHLINSPIGVRYGIKIPLSL